MTKENALKILELNPQELTNETIKKKYRQMALKYHPDKNKQENAAGKFQQIHEAYECLLNEKSEFNYTSILSSFLSNIIAEEVQEKLLTAILQKLSNLCSKSALFLLEKLTKMFWKKYSLSWKNIKTS